MTARLGWMLVVPLFLAQLGAARALPDTAPPGPDAAKAQATLQQMCAKVACRKTLWTFKLKTPKGSLESPVQPYPYLDDSGTLIIFPGETIGLAIAKKDSALGPAVLAQVKDPTGTLDLGKEAPPPTLSFIFEQMDDGQMMLTIENRIDTTIKFDVQMFVPVAGGIQSVKTSSCPVLPPQQSLKVFSGMEMWPNPVAMLAVSSIRALSPGAKSACE